jgi:hypothetical protein
MNKIYLFFIFFCLNPLFAQRKLTLQDLEGTWHIHLTNFPMWLKGDKTHPTFNYTVAKNGLLDSVVYQKGTKMKSIVGFDTPKTDSSFVWRGRGMLKSLKSNWKIIHMDWDRNWAIVQFDKTLFTPAGYDVIARDKVLNDNVLQAIQVKLKTLQIAPLKKIT